MNNKEFIKNYIQNEVSDSAQKSWQWMLNSKRLANEEENVLPYTPGVLQDIIIESNANRNRVMSMATIVKKYNQLEKLYMYADQQGQLKYNPFCKVDFVNLQRIVDIYFNNKVSTNYITKEKLNDLLIELSSRKTTNFSKAQTVMFVAALFSGIEVNYIKELKFSDFNLQDHTITLPTKIIKPISAILVDAVNYYQWVMDMSNKYDDYLIIPKKKCVNIDEYRKEQDVINQTVRVTLTNIGTSLKLYQLKPTDILNSGFIQYIKKKMDIETISLFYYARPRKEIERTGIAAMFNQLIFEYYYKCYEFYKVKSNKRFTDRTRIVGQTLAYLYKDEDYAEYRTKQIMS